MKRVLVLVNEKENINYKTILAAHGIETVFLESSDREEIVNAAKGAEAMIFAATVFDDDLFSRLPHLKLISRRGIGIDTVDIDAATRHGVRVCNCQSYGSRDVAQHTVALLLSLIHSIPRYNSRMSNNQGYSDVPMAWRLGEKTVGIIGYGRISKAVARVLTAFDAEVLVYDPFVTEAKGVRQVDLDELLKSSDIISLNAPLTHSTRHMINRETISRMKMGAMLVNTSRGALVDEEALIEALETGRLSGAALDVFENEPLDPSSRLLTLDNVVLTPHVAWRSVEAVRDLDVEVTGNVIDFFEGRPLRNALN